jgi:hypothetical protein
MIAHINNLTAAELETFDRVMKRPERIVVAPPGASVALIEAIRESAALENREFLEPPPPSRVARLAAEFRARDLPVIKGGDHRAFLRDLDKIAKGDMRVE